MTRLVVDWEQTAQWIAVNRMITIRQNTAWGLRGASRILLLCIIHASYAVAAESHPAKVTVAQGRNTRFAPLATKAGFRGDREERVDSTPRQFQNIQPQGGRARLRDPKFTHLTTNDGLSESAVSTILQDRRGLMWFATRSGPYFAYSRIKALEI